MLPCVAPLKSGKLVGCWGVMWLFGGVGGWLVRRLGVSIEFERLEEVRIIICLYICGLADRGTCAVVSRAGSVSCEADVLVSANDGHRLAVPVKRDETQIDAGKRTKVSNRIYRARPTQHIQLGGGAGGGVFGGEAVDNRTWLMVIRARRQCQPCCMALGQTAWDRIF